MMHKVVINTCYGGFGLSVKATAELFRRKHDAPLYFYKEIEHEWFHDPHSTYKKVSIEEADTILTQDFGEEFVLPQDHFGYELSDEQREIREQFNNAFIWDHMLIESRHDADLIAVVEQLGEEANGLCSELTIVEIEGSKYRVDEYDGNESIHTPETDAELYTSI